ncbi:hypothetical protein HBH98_117350 [Parastagonospora nodorum]|nr:hypothetical protein HBH49_223040 [Parastagonospora nodorum]KAH4157009.1 hypothetical protein HBH43_201620 [Parastagonospora nodorum]KAH4345903.1 hypothetical protein HBH98_117350 [Parastagonospora nodorum]KAH4378318.1 hypothetical protein HBH97_101570 [Parastagonospora nodorum]KAH4395810.1 hypothetical protein HBH99_129160 [Parastagonospora nodorum]
MRLYIVNATELIPVAQKHYRILDFVPVELKVAINVMGASPTAKKILIKNINGVEDFSYAVLFDKAIHTALSPGPGLRAMNTNSAQNVLRVVNELASQGPKYLKLMENFEPGIIILLLNLYPNLLARKSVQARKDIVEAFHRYFESGSHKQGSALVQAHYQHKVDQGAAGKDIAILEVGTIVGMLSNTIPAAFWVLYHVISDPAVLQECRQEVLACCTVENDVVTLDVSQIQGSNSILTSIFKEVLRYHGIGTSIRVVTQDHLLDGTYLLKKGGIVMIHGAVQHTSIPAYGENVYDFQHNRFVRSPGVKRPSPVAFRGFGGGSTLCPGRHFASTEVLAFVALMITRFDFKSTEGSWITPKTDNAGAHGTVAPPDTDVEVRISPGVSELADKKWLVVVSEIVENVQLSVEDMRLA